MTTSPVLSLRQAMLAVLSMDATLTSLLGGPARIYDEPPRGVDGVYAAFGPVSVKDWSTGSDTGHEQTFEIVVWSKPGGAKAALAASERIGALLHEAVLLLNGHRLVNLRVIGTDLSRDTDSRLARALVRLRAVTETL